MLKKVPKTRNKLSILNKIVRRVKWLCKKYPAAEYTNEEGNCQYTKGRVLAGPKQEGCLVGQALLHVCPEYRNKLEIIDTKTMKSASKCIIGLGFFRKSKVSDDSIKKLQFLDDIQSYQDEGHTWSNALVRATE